MSNPAPPVPTPLGIDLYEIKRLTQQFVGGVLLREGLIPNYTNIQIQAERFDDATIITITTA